MKKLHWNTKFKDIKCGDVFIYNDRKFMKANRSYSNIFYKGYKGNAIEFPENNWVSFNPTTIYVNNVVNHISFFKRIKIKKTEETLEHQFWLCEFALKEINRSIQDTKLLLAEVNIY